MTLKTVIADDFSQVILNTNELAETVTYYPKHGAERSVVGVVQEMSRLNGQEFGTQNTEEIWITVNRDPESSNGGIDLPQAGDGLRRASSVDVGQRMFAYTGMIEDVNPGSWCLQFARDILTRTGTENTQKR